MDKRKEIMLESVRKLVSACASKDEIIESLLDVGTSKEDAEALIEEAGKTETQGAGKSESRKTEQGKVDAGKAEAAKAETRQAEVPKKEVVQARKEMPAPIDYEKQQKSINVQPVTSSKIEIELVQKSAKQIESAEKAKQIIGGKNSEKEKQDKAIDSMIGAKSAAEKMPDDAKQKRDSFWDASGKDFWKTKEKKGGGLKIPFLGGKSKTDEKSMKQEQPKNQEKFQTKTKSHR